MSPTGLCIILEADLIQLLFEIINVTQNNTGMYTKENSQQTFKIPNNNLDVRFERTYKTKQDILPNITP